MHKEIQKQPDSKLEKKKMQKVKENAVDQETYSPLTVIQKKERKMTQTFM